MLKAVVLALILAAATPQPPNPGAPQGPSASALSAEGERLLGLYRDQIARARVALAAMPAAQTDQERIIRLGRLDQAARNPSPPSFYMQARPEERQALRLAFIAETQALDVENQKALLAMLPPEGWFVVSRYGADASQAAFLIVQHAGPELWERFLPILAPLVGKGEINANAYAAMFDRAAVIGGRPQRYGTQSVCTDGRMAMAPLEDPSRLNALRVALGLTPLTRLDEGGEIAC